MSAPESTDTEGSTNRAARVVDAFFKNLEGSTATQPIKDDPDYWTANPRSLLTTSHIGHLEIGTGEQIIEDIVPACQSAEHEIIIVTCFWAKSASQQRLANSLRHLAQRARAKDKLVSVRLCFSSRSLWQKCTHTSSLRGQIYHPLTWAGTFGLPNPDELVGHGVTRTGGVSLTVKSIFVKPFSVMHPKFIVIDRKLVFLPSCNISWENWFEGCVELRGDIVANFLKFYEQFWTKGDGLHAIDISTDDASGPDTDRMGSSPNILHRSWINARAIPTIFLPSPHHKNPRFRPTSLLSPPLPPPTPLNLFLLTILDSARNSIFIQTPNLTSPPVLDTLHRCLKRGVNVTIVTSTRMMLLEQIVTAGTVNEFCVRSLIRRHKKLIQQRAADQDPETASIGPGNLNLRYYKPAGEGSLVDMGTEPVKSHLKATFVDGYITVLGSGNMDRASWYTSQELGVAFFSVELANAVRAHIKRGLMGRLDEELISQLEDR